MGSRLIVIGTLTLFAGFFLAICMVFGAAIVMPGASYRGALEPLTSKEDEVARLLRRHVEKLASEIGPRSFSSFEGMDRASRYVASEFERMGYAPDRQTYLASGVTCANIKAVVPGAGNDVLVIGAHYDSVDGSPAANDNGSGVAVLVELARLLASAKPSASIHFVAFANEEMPHFKTADMGSFQYARELKTKKVPVRGMISLETMGYFSDESGSQHYPALLAPFYPKEGNFIAFVSNLKSRRFLVGAVKTFRRHARFPSEGIAGPESIEALSLSDHWSFQRHDFPALMVTDTAFFRYPFYHSPQDTPDKLDFERLARVVSGLEPMIAELAG